MFPILFHMGPLTLHTYGLLVAAGFLAGYYLVRRRFETNGLPLALFDQLIFILMVSGILGARFFYMGTDGFEALRADPLSFFRIWEGGLVYYGSFIGGVLGLVIYAKVKELSILSLGDAFAAPLLIAQSIGRLGCFAAGCCYGRATNSILGIVYSSPDSLAPLGVRLHPTQLYSSLGDFLLFVMMLQIEKKSPAKGTLVASYLIGYGAFRFMIEFLRNDDRGPFVSGLSPSQWISCAAILLGGALIIYAKKTQRA